MKKVNINGTDYQVDHLLSNYQLQKVESQNLDWVGHNRLSSLFVQFNSGRSYFYKVPVDFLMDTVNDPDKLQHLVSNFREMMKNYPFTRHFKKLIE